MSLLFPPFTHRYLVFDLLTFILLFNVYLQHSILHSTLLVSLQITISSANSIVHDGSFLTLSINLSIITANRNRLNTDPCHSLTLTFETFCSSYCTHLLPSYISCTSRTFFSAIPDFSYSTTVLLSEPCCKLSLGP